MASVCDDGNGRRRIQFTARDGKRYTIRLGKVSKSQAEAFKVKVEQLVAASFTGVIENETNRWLATCDDVTYGKLAAVHLVKPRETMTLGPWLEKYLAGRSDLKPKSKAALESTREKLVAYFKPGLPLRDITADQASEWRAKLQADGLSVASVKHHVGNAKGMFNEACRRELILANPFEHLSGGSTAASNERYVTPEEAARIIGACPDVRWRVLFGLARFAGLRAPSETHLLTWGDVDWERGRLNVRSPKTEHHAGHERRAVPIMPKLMKLLQDAFADAKEGEQHVVTLRGNGHVWRTMRVIIKRAGVEPWERLFQTLRSSCEREWAMSYPQFAVSKWIGHSIIVSGKHYANHVPDELYDQVAGFGKAAQNPTQQPAVDAGNESHGDEPAQPGVDASRDESSGCDYVRDAAISSRIRVTGFEPATSTTPR